jgi:hypothetical protein
VCLVFFVVVLFGPLELGDVYGLGASIPAGLVFILLGCNFCFFYLNE